MTTTGQGRHHEDFVAGVHMGFAPGGGYQSDAFGGAPCEDDFLGLSGVEELGDALAGQSGRRLAARVGRKRAEVCHRAGRRPDIQAPEHPAVAGSMPDRQRRRGLRSASGESVGCRDRNRKGFCGTPFSCTSKCRCGPVDLPVAPTRPIC